MLCLFLWEQPHLSRRTSPPPCLIFNQEETLTVVFKLVVQPKQSTMAHAFCDSVASSELHREKRCQAFRKLKIKSTLRLLLDLDLRN